MALLISASVSLAAACADDPNECTLKKLCEVATTVDGGNTTWSAATGSAKHVTVAQSLGMKCGITPIVDLCDTDPSECKLSQICGKATTDNAGQISWDDSAAAFVALAKEYGLSCDVIVEAEAVKKTCSASSPTGCTASALCSYATNKAGKWQKFSEYQGYVKEAKKRELSCGVVTIVDPCDLDPNECKIIQLCEKATKSDNGQTLWNSAEQGYVDLAKEYELTCDVGEEPLIDSVELLKQGFRAEPLLKRKQIQYALKKLGFYRSSVDGLWGRGTSSAIMSYAQSNSNAGGDANSIFNSALSEVDVPSSFAAITPKKKACSVSNPKVCTNYSICAFARLEFYRDSKYLQALIKEGKRRGLTCVAGIQMNTTKVAPKRTTTDTAGLSAIISNPSVTGVQAMAICGPQARLAKSQAGRGAGSSNSRVNCTRTILGLSCDNAPSSGWDVMSDQLDNYVSGKGAYNATLSSCLAQYGWRD